VTRKIKLRSLDAGSKRRAGRFEPACAVACSTVAELATQKTMPSCSVPCPCGPARKRRGVLSLGLIVRCPGARKRHKLTTARHAISWACCQAAKLVPALLLLCCVCVTVTASSIECNARTLPNNGRVQTSNDPASAQRGNCSNRF
jgi:hypothetical protein